ncbi:hypothetical protein HWV62_14576 [Athelia sp. TMB]|nr:hypothetical protein HWV62_14576 [Athelia sp. TMB]
MPFAPMGLEEADGAGEFLESEQGMGPTLSWPGSIFGLRRQRIPHLIDLRSTPPTTLAQCATGKACFDFSSPKSSSSSSHTDPRRKPGARSNIWHCQVHAHGRGDEQWRAAQLDTDLRNDAGLPDARTRVQRGDVITDQAK